MILHHKYKNPQKPTTIPVTSEFSIFLQLLGYFPSMMGYLAGFVWPILADCR